MALVREYGRPDLFITLTCNGNWREIKDNILPGQRPEDRPDIVTRVFNSKLKEFLDLITKKGACGKMKYFVYTIEFQKRGLPHCHFLGTLEEKLREIKDIDRAIIAAEIPDQNEDPKLYSLVAQHMLHGPCGSLNPNNVCMRDNKCSKKFPKQFRDATRVEQNGYPSYRRRDNGQFVQKHSNRRPVKLDNRYVVPYNRFLLKHFKAHINVELCSSVQSVKYLHKYSKKSYDHASIRIVSNNTANYVEITTYVSTRYVSPTEAAHRIFEFPMQGNSHWVMRLEIHLPQAQQVYFQEGSEEAALARAAMKNTKLTGWFRLNRDDPAACVYLYTEIPSHYTWNRAQRSFAHVDEVRRR